MKSSYLVLLVLALVVSSLGYADDRPYRDGTVWDITFVQVKDGDTDDYINNLKSGHFPILDAFVKKGWVTSYKVIGMDRKTPDDWNMMLLVEYPNFATFDRSYDDWDAEVKKVFKTDKDAESSEEQREAVRMIWGSRLGREMIPTN